MRKKECPDTGEIPFDSSRKLSSARIKKLSTVIQKEVFARNGETNETINSLILDLAANGSGDLADRADVLSAADVSAAALEAHNLNNQPKARILEIIAEGRYGMCQACGAEIPAERVKALPFKPVCIECSK